MKTLNELINILWEDYSSMNQQAKRIHELLKARGENIINDHIAFRTYNFPKIGVDVLALPFKRFGYKAKGEYGFPDKKLYARHYEHPDERNPRIFISELKVQECSKDLQKIVEGLAQQVTDKDVADDRFIVSGRLWSPISYKTYLKLKEESEYAAWMAVFGFRANHFTVLFNALKTFKDLQEFNQVIKDSGYPLNSAGGEIKGTPQDLLEQSSTLAHSVEVEFSESRETVPACYYEFARRYPKADGKLFSGFISQSADKIFESTDNKKS